MYYCPKRKAYKVLRWICRRVVLRVPVISVSALFLWVCFVVLIGYHQSRITLRLPLLGKVGFGLGASPRLDRDGFYVRDRREFISKYRLDAASTNSSVFREFVLHGSFDNMEDFPELGGVLGMFARGQVQGAYWSRAAVSCPQQGSVVGVTVSTRIETFQAKDAVVFGMMPKTLAPNLATLISHEPPSGQTWVYFSTESPFRAMRWVKDSDFGRLRYHKLMTYNSDADIPMPFGYTVSALSRKYPAGHNFSEGKTKLIAWMASNCEEIFWPRNEFVERVRELVRVDTYGRCGLIDCLPRGDSDRDHCKDLMGEYKFYLALANTECRDYITESFWDTALRHGTVPVVGGAPREDFERVAPPESFIHIGDFPSIKDLVEYLLVLDKDDGMYNRYFAWKRTSDVVRNFPPGPDVFCRILAHLGRASDSEERPRLKELGDSPWFRTCRGEVNIKSAVRVRSRVLDNRFDMWTPWRL